TLGAVVDDEVVRQTVNHTARAMRGVERFGITRACGAVMDDDELPLPGRSRWVGKGRTDHHQDTKTQRQKPWCLGVLVVHSSSARSILLSAMTVGLFHASISWSTTSTALICSCACGWLTSTTCNNKSASAVSSSVALNDSTRWCGSFRRKPTVSLSKMFWLFGSRCLRVVGSSVAKSLSSAKTPAPVSAFISVL